MPNKTIKPKAIKIIALFTVLISLLLLVIFENTNLQITKLEFKNNNIPTDFDGFVICHISDLHNTNFGEKQSLLLEKVKSNNPDIILITGDLVDSRRFNLEIAMDFINGAVNIAPVYYVSGNHEARLSQYPNIKSQLADAGVNVLDNQKISIEINNNYIDILGLSDPNFFNNKNEFEQHLKEWSESKSFKVLLSHRPELFDLYVKYNIDLTFSGHAHGGQIRLPFIGAMVAPNQGLLPKYTSGFYTQENSTMFVSRGIGNSIIPLRVLNRPEIAFITLSK